MLVMGFDVWLNNENAPVAVELPSRGTVLNVLGLCFDFHDNG